MALSRDTLTSSKGSGSISWSHTVSASSDRVLYVLVASRSNTGVTGITFGGVALTKDDDYAPSGGIGCDVWRLASPASGSGTVAVTQSGSNRIVAAALSYSGAVSTAPGAFSHDAANPGTAVSNTVSSAAGEEVVDVVAVFDDVPDETLTVGASQTELLNDNYHSTTGVRAGVSVEPGASSVTMSWTIGGGSEEFAHTSFAVQPAASTSNARNMLMMGVG